MNDEVINIVEFNFIMLYFNITMFGLNEAIHF